MVGTSRKRKEQSPEPAAAAALIASVLGNDDLLVEILLRLGSPTWLVRAALVRKRWLRLASDPAFLRRFRGLHPPRVLGISVREVCSSTRFFPVPQPPEFAAAARLAASAVETLGHNEWVSEYRNGRLVVKITDGRGGRRYAARSLLDAARDAVVPPQLPHDGFSEFQSRVFNRLFLLEDDGDPTSCLYLSMVMVCNMAKVCAKFSILRSGVWSAWQFAVTELLQEPYYTSSENILLSGSKVYMMTTEGSILVLDLASATFCIVKLPDGVGCISRLNFSRAQHSGLYLIDVMGYQLRVWFWNGDGAEQWELVDTIPVCEACQHLNVQRWETDDDYDDPVLVVRVGDNAEFVILGLVASGIVCFMQLGNRAVVKLFEGLEYYGCSVCPIKMVWPPIFPVLEYTSEEC